jgi:hypothetical protein
LGVRDTYAIVRDGLPFAETKPVAACSTVAHGIDVLILRAATHRSTPVVEWGDPQELQRGDELMVYARKEFAAEPSRLKFLHLNLKEWAPPTRGYGREWENTMVAEGMTRSGFSGSPWARGSKVYGLHKGRVSLPGQTTMYPVAETALRVKDCLQQLRYELLLPQN